ncbi:hypothetical protein C8035_v006560 [Colletotrichum spinosum]|uniref:Uncharacterized protein n=1 Tax=Colletotrichum spinosum TaxID=1347390 RepID=A0A4R8QS64_9PEZI|nr:hypothetical protein C8035_v006560 [Colletotrichum spinosum]
MCWLLDETRDVKRWRSRAQNPHSEAWNPWAGRRGGRKRQLDLNSDSPKGTGWGNSDAGRLFFLAAHRRSVGVRRCAVHARRARNGNSDLSRASLTRGEKRDKWRRANAGTGSRL